MTASIHALLEDLAETRLRVPQHVVHRAFPAETVLLNLNTGRYHGLNATAARAFELLAAGGTVADAAGALATECARPLPEVEADVRELCTELLERGLLEADVGRPR